MIYCWHQVFEVAPSLFMVELRKKGGDTLEYHNVSPCVQHSSGVLQAVFLPVSMV